MRNTTWVRRALTGVLASSLSLVTLIVVAPAAAAAVSPVLPAADGRVTADPLPTVQLDNPTGKAIVWTQTISGNTVYAGGTFANVKPAGGTTLIPRGNLLAYDITTGALITKLAPALNSTVKALAVSPNGKVLYVGGSFTTADGGVTRNRIAAYDTATGTLITTFRPSLNATVTAIAATDTTVYVAGYFGVANSVNRTRLAAFNAATGAASDGSLTTWAPTADYDINAMVMTPDRGKIVIGGGFQTVNGTPTQGITAVDAGSGALQPWPVNQVIHNGNAQSGTYSLSTDSDTVYGTAYNYGTGDFEGQFATRPDGSVKWLADCHGDTYAAFSADNGIVYGAGHAHHCVNIGGFDETNPRSHRFLMAFTKDATGTVNQNSQGGNGYGNFAGQPSPSIINYFPAFTTGTASGKTQAVWSLTGNKQYLAAGGEFPRVNGKVQYGLVRFAVPTIAPNKSGPVELGGVTNPTVAPIPGYGARVSWKLNWDYDDTNLTYKVVRSDKPTAPLLTTTLASTWWQRPLKTFVDKTAAPGSTYRYRIIVNDPSNNMTQSDYVSVTMPTTTLSAYGKSVLDDGATNYWRLGDANQPTMVDLAGGNDQVKSTGVSAAPDGAIAGDPDTSAAYDGTAAGVSGSTSTLAGPDTFSAEAWFKTTTTSGGKILGFGNSQTGTSNNYDRHVYMDNSGRVVFGVYPGSIQTVATPDTFNDGAWHHVVAQMSPGGMVLWMDGIRQGTNPNATGQPYTGYWRIGGDNTNAWPNRGSSNNFAGQIDDVAIYPTALTETQLRNHFTSSGRSLNLPFASFTASCVERACAFDGSASSDADGSITGYAWSFGDGTTGTGVAPSHSYAADGTYAVSLTVTDNQGNTTETVKQVVAKANAKPVAAFTASCTSLSCAFDASGSSDTDGTVASYAWDFGDASTGSGRTATHAYAVAGTYTVTLRVTDDKGLVGSTTKTLSVSQANAKPVASFTSTCSTAACSFNASGSSDSDGTVASYAWQFGDGTTGTGATVNHPYASGGTFTVQLTVTDDGGATASTSKSVTVVGDSPTVAADQFSRTGSGWGSADTGGAYTLSGGSTPFSTNGSAGLIKLSAGTNVSATLGSTSATDVTVDTDIAADKVPTGTTTNVNLVARKSGTSSYTMKVRFMADGTMHLAGSRITNGSEVTLREVVVTGLTYTPGTTLRARFTVTGTSTVALSAKLWKASATEPTTNQFSFSDTAAPLQSAGSVGVSAYLPSTATNAPVLVTLDNLSAVKP